MSFHNCKNCPKCLSTEVENCIYGYTRDGFKALNLSVGYTYGGITRWAYAPNWKCQECRNYW